MQKLQIEHKSIRRHIWDGILGPTEILYDTTQLHQHDDKKPKMYLKNCLIMLCNEIAVSIQSIQIKEKLKFTDVGKIVFNASDMCRPSCNIIESETK